MARQIKERVFELRDWQSEAYKKAIKYVEAGEKNFLCVATPGSGKTIFGLRVGYELLKSGYADRIQVVTPTEQLKRQWAGAAAAITGIDIDPDFSNSMGTEAADYHGIAVTYALIGQDKKGIHAQNTFKTKTFVIFDEPHHMGESMNWGDSCQKSFEDAVFRLLISGTPFRSDDNKIPFVKYDPDTKMSIADYTYSYDQAIKDNVCRPVYFQIYDGQMKWKVGESEFDHSFQDHLEPDQVSKRLKTALDPNGNWVKDILSAADKKLSEIRLSHKDAAAMAFAATQKHAHEIAKVIEEITGNKPPVIVSEDGNGNEKINEFRRNSDRWLVSVKMVSEGVDIPRLRIGAYLTITKAELFFRQAVGRFVRVLSHLQYQDAFIFIPKDKDLVKLAQEINAEREHALDQAKNGGNGFGGDPDMFGTDYTPALEGRFIPLGSTAFEGDVIEISVGISSGMKQSVVKTITHESPVFEQKEALRKRLGALAKRIALKQRNGNSKIKPEDWKYAHKVWKERGGKEMGAETVKELESREIFYRQLLRG